MRSQSDEERPSDRVGTRHVEWRRRRIALGAVLTALTAVVAVALLGTSGGSTDSAARSTVQRTAPKHAAPARPRPAPRIALGAIPPARPGKASLITHGPAKGRMVALTFDDGFCAVCVTTLVRGLQRTGAHATLFPNGTYGSTWSDHARAIRAMIARGQVIVGSHTFSHVNAPAVGPAVFAADLDRNERWIQRTFGVTGRPYLRPPYGAYNAGTLQAAGAHGYTKVVTWNGTVADSGMRTRAYLVNAIKYWARPGAIILLHANYPPTAEALPAIVRVLRRKRLRTATLQELIGGSPYRLAR
jgi:peptidoglycan-N-acetylglucosamine deacetylase